MDKRHIENKKKIYSINVLEYHAVYEIKWKNVVKPGRLQMTIDMTTDDNRHDYR